MKLLRIASRKSPLAIIQTKLMINEIKKKFPEIKCEIVTFDTKGDKILDKSLETIGGKGLFIQELENALEKEEVDICVHSLKDMPYDENPDFPILTYSRREDPRDVLCLKKGIPLENIKIIGTSSPRRREQYLMINKNANIKLIRGNIQTRLKKVDSGEFDGAIFAKAGLLRGGYSNRISYTFPTDEIIPAAGQGIIAVQGSRKFSFLHEISNKEAEIAAKAERNIVKLLCGDCTTPIAAYAEIQNGKISLKGFFKNGNKINKVKTFGYAKDYLKLSEDMAKALVK